MKRRSFLTAASAALFTRAGISSGAEFPAHDVALPSRLGATDVAALRDTASYLRALAHEHGHYGGLLMPTVNRAERLLDVPAAEGVQLNLLSAIGELHRMAAWSAFDASADGPCREHLRRALELSSSAGDAYAAAWTSGLSGTWLAERGHPADAVPLFQLGQAKLRDISPDDHRLPGLTARLHADSARWLAVLGDDRRTRFELQAAQDWTPTSDGHAVTHALYFAHTERECGNLDVAAQHAQQASKPRGSGPDRRTAVFGRITLADLWVKTGESSGAELAEQVIRDAEETRSPRVRNWLSQLVPALNERGETDLARQARRVTAHA